MPFSLATLQLIVGTSLGVTMISVLETLMAARIAGGASKMQPNRLVVGLGMYILSSSDISFSLSMTCP